jgi:glycine dehydrogenase subunit 2
MLIFERSRPNRRNAAQQVETADISDLPSGLRRTSKTLLPEVSELDVVRHYTRLSQLNFSIDTQFYPLGSCTMKYNPRAANALAQLPGFIDRHPLAPDDTAQGLLGCLWELQDILADVTGMSSVCLSPMAGAQGEFAGIAMIRAYHAERGDHTRSEIIVPDAAHGTNPASASMCGYSTREIPTDRNGDVDLAALKSICGSRTAGLMLTNPSTLGVFERHIEAIAATVHEAGGLLYYDGANLNAILGKVKPCDMGFDVVHLNLHKTFSTPHGGGGPGAGAVGANALLAPFLPVPQVAKEDGRYRWLTEADRTRSIGRLSAFMGNIGVLLRAWAYARLLGRAGMRRVAEHATLNANYLLHELQKVGFEAAYPSRRASHEFVLTLKNLKENCGVSAMDVCKRLLDKGFHAPTAYFPLLVPECLLVEPTETESRETLDAFVAAMGEILSEAHTAPELVKNAPHSLPLHRLDDVRAAREPDLAWRPSAPKV